MVLVVAYVDRGCAKKKRAKKGDAAAVVAVDAKRKNEKNKEGAAEASTERRKEERNEEATTECRSKKEEDELPSAVTVVEVPIVEVGIFTNFKNESDSVRRAQG